MEIFTYLPTFSRYLLSQRGGNVGSAVEIFTYLLQVSTQSEEWECRIGSGDIYPSLTGIYSVRGVGM